MKSVTTIIIGIALFSLFVIALTKVFPKNEEIQEPVTEELTSLASSFSWNYEDGGNNLDGIPGTNISLTVAYENGAMVTESIDSVDGSCNDIDSASEDTDMVAGTTKIQCYAAGFGQWYKVIQGDDSYHVVRKYFEEALPDVEPEEYQYEVVAQLPLMQ